MVSPFAGVFASTTMTRNLRVIPTPTVPPTPLPVDAAGQPLYPTVAQTLVVIADPAPARVQDALREQAGASAIGTLLLITCLDPMQLPDDVQPGVEFSMPYAARPGVLRVIARPTETLTDARDALGDILYGAWRSTP